MPKIKAVILVGGPGTRLRPLTEDRPKSIVPVLNYPAMEHTFAYLREYGIEDIILAMSYLPEVIKDNFGDGNRCGVRLTYCLETEPLGTAGAVKNAAKYLDSTFLVMNGDIFTDLNLTEMISFHHNNKAKATISLTWVEDPSAFGVVETDDSNKVKKFIEKPPLAEATTHWINAGIYILEPEVMSLIPADTHYMFENGLFPSLLDIGERVCAYPYKGFWLDMGSPRQYFSLNVNLLTSKVKIPCNYLTEQLNEEINTGKNVNIDSSAVIKPPVIIGDGCRIGPEVKITGPVLLGKGCLIDRDTKIENTILWDNVNIGDRTEISHCIIVSCTKIIGHLEIKDSIVTPSGSIPLPY